MFGGDVEAQWKMPRRTLSRNFWVAEFRYKRFDDDPGNEWLSGVIKSAPTCRERVVSVLPLGKRDPSQCLMRVQLRLRASLHEK